MRRVMVSMSIALVCGSLGISNGADGPAPQKDSPKPLLISDLHPKLDRKQVTVKFTVTGLDGIAQLTKEGQAPSFLIETESAQNGNRLSVWVEGELANVLDRLQMSYLQENQLKVGTTIEATGLISVHTKDSRLFLFSATTWKNFRILPTTRTR